MAVLASLRRPLVTGRAGRRKVLESKRVDQLGTEVGTKTLGRRRLLTNSSLESFE